MKTIEKIWIGYSIIYALAFIIILLTSDNALLKYLMTKSLLPAIIISYIFYFICARYKPKRMEKSFEEYIKLEMKNGNTNFYFKTSKTEFGKFMFYIHPQNNDKEIACFDVCINTLYPWSIKIHKEDK